MPDSKAKRAWDKQNMTYCMVKLFHSTDKDILRFLAAQGEPKATVFKRAIREYMITHSDQEE